LGKQQTLVLKVAMVPAKFVTKEKDGGDLPPPSLKVES
jgi:hypothetical protein